jgi:hypothetical protein
MADGAKVTVTGDDTLRRTMAAAADDLENLDQTRNARLVQERAKQGAPKVSGVLAASIVVKDSGKGSAVISSDLIYAPVIHYGWAARNITPQPFLTDALEASAGQIEDESERQAQAILSHVRGA